jgi:ParB-like chromosome segregation protein Spo0J
MAKKKTPKPYQPPVHPLAAMFPLLGADDMRALAADIKANGLLRPIVLNQDGVLLDGRNRQAACLLAGVEPRYVTIQIDDPVQFIIAENVNRRHMTKGALAMVMTMSQRANGGGGVTQVQLAKLVGVGKTSIEQASIVAQYAPTLVDKVIAGGSLEQAYAVAVANKQRHEDDQQALGRLKRKYPDLYERVKGETLSLADAIEVSKQVDAYAKRRKQVEALQEEVALAEEEIGFDLNISLDEALADVKARGLDTKPANGHLTAGDVMEEVLAAIDVTELERADQAIKALTIRSNLLRLLKGNKPEDICAGLPIEDVAAAEATMERVVRWAHAAYTAAYKMAHGGKLEIVR